MTDGKHQVFMAVKTYPTPSEKYAETVCTAGISDTGEWVRMYPVLFRQLSDEKKFKIFSWIEADMVKADRDLRPESYRVNPDSIKFIRNVDSRDGLAERKKLLLPLLKPSMECVVSERAQKGTSLAIVRPKEALDVIATKADPPDWTEAELRKLGQQNFFDNSNGMRQLRKVPYEFRFVFKCDDEKCSTHKCRITSWEVGQTFFQYRQYYGSEGIAIQKLKDWWMSRFSGSMEGNIIVGTTTPYQTFIVIGHFAYKKTEPEGQTSFFG